MKKLFLIFLLISSGFLSTAQLEFYHHSRDTSLLSTNFFRSSFQGIPLYYQNNRTINPFMFDQMILDFQEETLFPGMSVCILRDGSVFWKNHYGWADIAKAKPVNDETTYTVASISKTIMITAVMQLYEQGLFGLDDDISAHIPFQVRNPNHLDIVITIRQLMTHTSSIADNYDILWPVLYEGGDSPVHMNTFLQGYLIPGGDYYTADNFYDYTPGYTWNYTNVGSCLLACMVECFTGTGFETYCQQHIFGPLTMTGTSYLFANTDPENQATPYTISGNNVIEESQSSWPIYPIGNLKTSAMQLAKHLGMYMNYGHYGTATLLDSASIELVTQVHYTNNADIYQGLIWFCHDPIHDFSSHTGGWIGFSHIYGFNKEENYGMIWLSNGTNDNAYGQLYDFWVGMAQFARQYEPFSYEALTVDDSDGDRILEPGEVVEVYLDIRNNTNLSALAMNVNMSFSTDYSGITFLDDTIIPFGNINYLEEAQNLQDPLIFVVGQSGEPGTITIRTITTWNDSIRYASDLELYAGQADILVVNDETDMQGNLILTPNWYLEALDSIVKTYPYDYQYYDYSVESALTNEFLNGFKAVIWFTGYDTVNTLTGQDQQVLAQYLDSGGNLFLTGQNISEDLDGTLFLTDYLHTIHIASDWEEMMMVWGTENDPVFDGIFVKISNTTYAETGANNQDSPGVITAEVSSGGEQCMNYFPTEDGCGVRYEGNYKTVFLSFGFEGISTKNNRVKVMERILRYFDVIAGEEEMQVTSCRFKVFPNPTSGISKIKYQIAESRNVLIQVYDIHGERVFTLVNEDQPAGEHTVYLDVSALPAGIYLIRLQTGDSLATQKLIVLR